MDKKKELVNWLCLLGVFQFLFYILHDVIGSLNYPGYVWFNQAVSDLTAVDSPARVIASGLSNAYNIFAVVSMSSLCVIVSGKGNKIFRVGIYLFTIMIWISAIGYPIFPLSEGGYAGRFQDIIHLYVLTIIIVFLSITSLILITIGGIKNKETKIIAIIAIIALSFMMTGAIGSGMLAGKTGFGLFERFSTYSAVVFGSILSVYGFRFKIE